MYGAFDAFKLICRHYFWNFCCDLDFPCFEYISASNKKSHFVTSYFGPEKTSNTFTCNVTFFAQCVYNYHKAEHYNHDNKEREVIPGNSLTYSQAAFSAIVLDFP